MITIVTSLTSGAAFGAALVAAGVYQPSVIIGQLKLDNWHMIQTFLAAAASSTVIVAGLGKLGYVSTNPRKPVSLGLATRYDGNIIGGSLLGVGMALSGSCPGTVLAQVGVGARSGLHALDGALLGGLAYATVVRPWQHRSPCERDTKISSLPPAAAAVAAAAAADKDKDKDTVHNWLGISRPAAAAGFAVLAASVAVALAYLTPRSPYAHISPILGGLLVGLSQLFSGVARQALLGSSTAYEEAGDLFWWLVGGGGADSRKKRPRAYRNLLFAAGVVLGASAVAGTMPRLTVPVNLHPTPLLATAGGFLMVLGSRIAGGCTSGHGISGMSMLSLSSFVTIGMSLVVGSLVAPLVY